MTTFFVDLDGTIIDPKMGMVGSFRAALEHIGRRDLASGDLDWIIGPPIIDSFEKLLASPDERREALKIYRRSYTKGKMFDFSIYPGIIEAMRDLNQPDSRLFICTMKPTAFATPILAELGLEYRLFGADLDGNVRHKDQLLHEALRLLNVCPTECVVIGDRGSDMIAARANNMNPLGVTWGYGTPAELTSAGAERLCDSPAELARTARDMPFSR